MPWALAALLMLAAAAIGTVVFTRIPLRPRRVAVPDFEPTESEAILRAMRDPEDPLRFPNPRGEGDEEHGHDGLHREAA